MKRKTGDLPGSTSDTKIFDGGSGDADPAAETLDINDAAAATVEITDPDAKRHIVGGRSALGSATVAGGYHILRKIGEGGMGIVYEAEQQHPRRLVALKVIRGGTYASDYHVKMFEREIQALARLKHPGIVSIYEAGRFDDGQVFFAMELLHGRSLMEFAEDRETADGKFAVEERLQLFTRICEIVCYAHQRGVIHRDLKPQNIFVTDEDTLSFGDSTVNKARVKILDFGLARITDPEFAGGTDVSQIGQIKGTLNYMSPEQLTGNPADVDVRSDIYSLGVILYELLSGRLPYDTRRASVPEAMRIIGQQPPEPLRRALTDSIREGRSSISRVDADVETIVMKALEKEPARRYQSVAAMLDDIGRYFSSQPILARPPSAFYQFRKLVTRHKTASASLAGLLLMLLAFGAVMAAQNARIAIERDKAWVAQQMAEDQESRAEVALEREQEQRLIAEQNLARAEEQQKAAEHEKAEAEIARKNEQEQRVIAERNLKAARTERIRAEQQTAFAEKQEKAAREQKVLAETRRAEAEEQKALAEQREQANRGLLYTSQMNLAEQAWRSADVERLNQLLEVLRPKPGQRDLRGFEWYYLAGLAAGESWKRDFVHAAAFSPADDTMAVNSFSSQGQMGIGVSSKVVVLNQATGKEITEINEQRLLGYMPDGRLLTIPFKPDIAKLAAEFVKQIDVGTLDSLAKKTNEQAAAEMRERVREIMTQGMPESAAVIWDPKTGSIAQTKLKLIPNLAMSCFLSPDGRYLVEEKPRAVDVYDITTGEKILAFGDRTELSFAGFSRDGARFALNNSNYAERMKKVEIWDLAEKRAVKVLEGDYSTIGYIVRLSPDGNSIASRTGDTLIYSDIAGKRQPHRVNLTRTGENFGSGIGDLVFTPDGTSAAVIEGRAVILMKPCDREVIKGHSTAVGSAAFSRDGSRLATVGRDGRMKVWPIQGCKKEWMGHDPSITVDGRILATMNGNKATFWDPAKEEVLGTLPDLRPDDSHLRTVEISPDGTLAVLIRVITGSAQNEPVLASRQKTLAELWDLNGRVKVAEFDEGTNRIAFSPNGKILAVIRRNNSSNIDDHDVHLWDLETKRKIRPLSRGYSVSFSPDGRYIAVANSSEANIFEMGTWAETGQPFKVRSLADKSVVFSADGKRVATINENDVLVWDFHSRKLLSTLSGHAGSVMSIAFSRDDRRIVTSSPEDNTVKIWDAENFQLLSSFDMDNASTVLFSPAGDLIVEGSKGTTIWRASTPTGKSSKPK